MMQKKSYQETLEKKGGPLFVPFMVLGYPDKTQSREVLETLIKSGADALELGFPFSDPPADGPIIQKADTRALESGMHTDDCFDLIRNVRETYDLPIGILVYYNLVLARGVETFYRECGEAGVNSVLIADVPLEHANEIVPFATAANIEPVFIISELSSDARIEAVAKIAKGYIYVVSYVGITGVSGAVFEEKTASLIARIRRYSSLPVCVGFGISTPDDAHAVVCAGADGVIVGSRIVREVPDKAKTRAICQAFSDAIKKAA